MSTIRSYLHLAVILGALVGASACTTKVSLEESEPELLGEYGFNFANDPILGYEWGTAKLIKGNRSGLTITGVCQKDIDAVRITVEGQHVGTPDCSTGAFAIQFNPGSVFTTNKQFKITGTALIKVTHDPALTQERTYDYYNVDGTTLVGFTSPLTLAESTNDDFFDFVGNCRADHPGQVTTSASTVTGTTTCRATEQITRRVENLVYGANTVVISMSDDYGNVGTKTYTITRNDTNAPVLVFNGWDLVLPDAVSQTSPDLTLAHVASSEFDFDRDNPPAWVTPLNDPLLSFTCASGTCGEGSVSVGNLSFIYSPTQE